MPQPSTYPIGGVDVKFPHQPYGVQFSFMGKVVVALEKQQNALLESPTGSGKTLSLLCSSLAWQAHQRQRVHQDAAAERAVGMGCESMSALCWYTMHHRVRTTHSGRSSSSSRDCRATSSTPQASIQDILRHTYPLADCAGCA